MSPAYGLRTNGIPADFAAVAVGTSGKACTAAERAGSGPAAASPIRNCCKRACSIRASAPWRTSWRRKSGNRPSLPKFGGGETNEVVHAVGKKNVDGLPPHGSLAGTGAESEGTFAIEVARQSIRVGPILQR